MLFSGGVEEQRNGLLKTCFPPIQHKTTHFFVVSMFECQIQMKEQPRNASNREPQATARSKQSQIEMSAIHVRY